MAVVKQRRALVVGSLAGLVLTATMLVTLTRPDFRPGVLEVTALDVGQGDSIFVVTPTGKTLLVDSGGSLGAAGTSFDIGEEVVSPFLWARGVTHLDAVAVRNGHADHMGGMRSVIANFRPHELWTGSVAVNPELIELLGYARERGVIVRRFSAGERFAFGGTELEVLAPDSSWTSSSTAENNDSLVLKVSYAGHAALLEGDAEKKVEQRIVRSDASADVLKVGHHGSLTSTAPELLAAVRPRFAVITAGKDNRFGYPKPQILARLQRAHVATYRTDVEGAVTFLIDQSGVRATLPNRP